MLQEIQQESEYSIKQQPGCCRIVRRNQLNKNIRIMFLSLQCMYHDRNKVKFKLSCKVQRSRDLGRS